MISEIEKKIWSLVEKNVADQGFDLIDVKVRRAQKDYMVEILVDRPQGGITIDECAMLNRQIASLLEAQAILDADYMLDVSSPGIDRPLMSVKDFLRSCGKEIVFYLKEPVQGRIEYRGIVQRVQNEQVDILYANTEISIPIQCINKAKQII